MAKTDIAFNWKVALEETFNSFTVGAMELVPKLAGVIGLFLLGLAIAFLLRFLTIKIVRGLDSLFERSARHKGLDHVVKRDGDRPYSRLAGGLVFWAVLLFFVASSANLLNWPLFTSLTQSLIVYLPSVLAGLFIILAGFALGGVVATMVASAANRTGIKYSALLARSSQVTIILTALVIGVEQLGINLAFFSNVIIVAIGVLLFGLALAFGLGAKDFSGNIIGAQTSRKIFQEGQLLRVGNIEGRLLEITPTAVVLEGERGKFHIPARLVHEQVSEVLAEEESPDKPLFGGLFTKTKGEGDGAP